jgi:uncharacterized damage-inducible protein DinB
MTPTELLADAFERVREGARTVLEGLSTDDLRHRPGPDANPIGWLVWHLARVQDDHVADVADAPQVYGDFVDRFALPYDPVSIGYGHSSEDVAAFAAPADLLAEYVEAVHTRTLEYLATLSGDDLDRVVDEHWDPPVTLGTRLVSVVVDDTQHVGQAAYVRGLLGRG